MALIGKPFKDRHGKIGRPTKPTQSISGKLQFGEGNDTHILLILPDGKQKYVSKQHGIKLAHWLLDRCSR